MTSIITYEEMKNFYEDFKRNLPTDEFDRFYKEYSFVKSLIKFAKEENLKDEIKEYKQIQKNAIERLKKMGYKFI